LPTNGFLGFEDFGIYQEKPTIATVTVTTSDVATESPADSEDKQISEEEQP